MSAHAAPRQVEDATPPGLPRKMRLLAIAVAAVIAVCAAMTVYADTGDPTAELSVPAQASLGGQIAVVGSGFDAGQTGNLTYNGGVVESFVASPAGTFTVSLTVPPWARLGAGRVSAKTVAERLLATTTLEIVSATPAPTDPPAPTATPVTPAGTPVATDSPATPAGSPLATPAATVAPTDTPPATPLPTSPATPAPTAAPSTPSLGSLPNFSHVYVIVFENHEYSSIVGSSAAPYINSLISQYGLATSYYAVGHPSEPNYIALTSGSMQGITDDGVYNLGANNIFSQVAASGRTWKAYQQGNPGNCFTGSSSGAVADGVGKSGTYVRKHNPAISYTSISGSSACSNITNLAGFDPAAANFEFITPNLINDMHDGSIADGDNFLKAFLPQITGSAAFGNSVVFVTFDEGTSNVNGGGHVVTIAITPNMTPGFRASDAYNHYSMLRTIEQAWGLPTLGNAFAAAAMAFPY